MSNYQPLIDESVVGRAVRVSLQLVSVGDRGPPITGAIQRVLVAVSE